MTEQEIVRLLHIAADRIGGEMYTPTMDALAAAGARFIAESDLHDEYAAPFIIRDPSALGYGVMLGWLAREAAP